MGKGKFYFFSLLSEITAVDIHCIFLARFFLDGRSLVAEFFVAGPLVPFLRISYVVAAPELILVEMLRSALRICTQSRVLNCGAKGIPGSKV